MEEEEETLDQYRCGERILPVAPCFESSSPEETEQEAERIRKRDGRKKRRGAMS